MLMPRKSLRKPTDALLAILAENIRAHRHAQNLSQEAFADLCGLHRTYIGSIERAERNVTLSSLEILANTLGVTIPDLLVKKKKKR